VEFGVFDTWVETQIGRIESSKNTELVRIFKLIY